MDFRLDDDQLAMRDAVRSLCADRFDLARVAEREGVAADDRSWSGLAGLGVLGMLDEASDADVGVVEAAVVFEELGAHLVSGPVLWSTLTASLVPGVADGSVRVAGVEVGAGWTGPVVVEHGQEADVLVVVHDDRAERCRSTDLVGVEAGSSIDPLTPATILHSVPVGEVVADGAAVAELRRTGRILSAALLVGGAQGALDVARDHALEREQFGVPIGSFQAIKHLLADAYVRAEMARASVYAAAAIAAGRGDGDPDRAGRVAKHLAGEAALANSRTAIQVLGGMGFTWEMQPHLFLKRALVLDQVFGTSREQAAHLGAAVGSEVASA